jgi:tyrosyl-tRNA synthetase
LFSNTAIEALKSLNEKQLLEVMEGVPQVNVDKKILDVEGVDLIAFLAEQGIYSSKGEARKALLGNAVSVNKEKVTDIESKLQVEHLLNQKYILIQKGKSNYTLVIFE